MWTETDWGKTEGKWSLLSINWIVHFKSGLKRNTNLYSYTMITLCRCCMWIFDLLVNVSLIWLSDMKLITAPLKFILTSELTTKKAIYFVPIFLLCRDCQGQANDFSWWRCKQSREKQWMRNKILLTYLICWALALIKLLPLPQVFSVTVIMPRKHLFYQPYTDMQGVLNNTICTWGMWNVLMNLNMLCKVKAIHICLCPLS